MFLVQENLETLGPLSYTSEELDFAYKIQEATSKPKLGINGKITPLKPTSLMLFFHLQISLLNTIVLDNRLKSKEIKIKEYEGA